MPDHPQSTDQPQSPSPPVASSVFRESFVARFQRPDDEAAIRMLAELADNLISENREYLAAEGKRGSIWLEAIRGAVGDVRQAADMLADVARDLEEADSGGRHVVRVLLAIADAAGEVKPIAARLDGALAAYLDAPAE